MAKRAVRPSLEMLVAAEDELLETAWLHMAQCRRCPDPCGGTKVPLGREGKVHKRRICLPKPQFVGLG